MSHKDPAYVAEQTGIVLHTSIHETPLEPVLAQARAATLTEAMGALVEFTGIVRDHDGGQRVASLTYSAHPQAEAILAQVAAAVSKEHPNVRLWTAHRVGPLKIGEVAFVVLAASAHRRDSFTACAELADRVKAEVPIWKEQALRDGSTTWVGLE